MKVIKRVVRTQTVDEIHEILCNKCGLTCLPRLEKSEPPYRQNDFYGLIEQSVNGGYFSEDFEDGDIYTFSMCEKCLVELFKTFIIPPEKQNFI